MSDHSPAEQQSDTVAPDAVAATALAEVQFLCRQRYDALESDELTAADLEKFERRTAGFVDALLARGPRVLEWLIKILPEMASPAEACGVASVLLTSRDPQAAQAILAALETAEEPLSQGLRMALCREPIEALVPTLKTWLDSGSPVQAAAAAEALALHRKLDARSPRLEQLLADANPRVRQAAWRATALAGEPNEGHCMRIILEAIDGPHSPKRIVLGGHQNGTFGRTEWADFHFPDDIQMSSKHFEIEGNGLTCLIRDLNSTNGTFVNEERVVESALATGSVIRAGLTKIRVTLEETGAFQRPVSDHTRDTTARTPPDTLDKAAGSPRPADRLQKAPAAPKRGASPYQLAIADDDPLVRRAAILAAAWTCKPWLLEYCRSLSAPPVAENGDALYLLAVLGHAADLPRILAAGRATDLGPRRFKLLGAFGHPEVVNDLIVGIDNKEPEVAVAAGNAFMKITGVDIRGYEGQENTGETAVPGTAKREALDGSILPSPARAARRWRAIKADFSAGERWVRGFDATRGLSPETLQKIDLESRFEEILRARFQGAQKAWRLDIEQLAQQLWSAPEETT